jgi:hypothetical protein
MNKKTSNPPSQGYSTSEKRIDYMQYQKRALQMWGRSLRSG